MARRLFNGRAFSENGWPYVDQGSCTWARIPGAEHVSLLIQNGASLQILRAFAADYHAYVEPLRNADSACWTQGNKVATSNHPGGTAMDLNWNGPDSRTFRYGISKERAFPGGMTRALDELYAFYEDIMFCGGGWDILDWMHHQLRAGTYDQRNDRPTDRVNDFIRRKIRSDGFSTFRRDGTPVPPPPSPPLSKADQYALAIIAEGRSRGITARGIQIALATAQVESGMRMYANSNVPASLNLPHDAVGSDHDSVGLFQQRHPMWGPLDVLMDPAKSAGLFYDRLVKMNYNDPNRSPGSFAADIQRPAAQYRGRYDQQFGYAVALYNRLAGTPTPQPLPVPVPVEEGFLMALSDQQQQDLFHAIMNQRPSRSPLRHLGETNVGDTPDQVWDIDSSVHILVVSLLARLGSPKDLALLREVATADPTRYPDRQEDKLLAQAILADITSTPEPAPPAPVYPVPAPVVYQPPLPLPAIPERNGSTPEHTTGELIGQVFDALDALRLADALPIEARAPLAALISVLQVKNGSTL